MTFESLNGHLHYNKKFHQAATVYNKQKILQFSWIFRIMLKEGCCSKLNYNFCRTKQLFFSSFFILLRWTTSSFLIKILWSSHTQFGNKYSLSSFFSCLHFLSSFIYVSILRCKCQHKQIGRNYVCRCCRIII